MCGIQSRCSPTDYLLHCHNRQTGVSASDRLSRPVLFSSPFFYVGNFCVVPSHSAGIVSVWCPLNKKSIRWAPQYTTRQKDDGPFRPFLSALITQKYKKEEEESYKSSKRWNKKRKKCRRKHRSFRLWGFRFISLWSERKMGERQLFGGNSEENNIKENI